MVAPYVWLRISTSFIQNAFLAHQPKNHFSWGPQGIEWPGGSLRCDKFEYSFGTTPTEWEPLSDAVDESIPEILKWCFNSTVLKVPGKDIIFEEELRYIVQKTEVSDENCTAAVSVFDVRCQEIKMLTFQPRK